jgi:hypothetical protein
MKSLVQFLKQIPCVLWFMWWGVWAILLPFDQHGYSDIALPDCDTDGEAVAWLSMWVIWLTTVFSLGVSVYIRFGRNLGRNSNLGRNHKALYFINSLALLLSAASLIRYNALLEYSKELKQFCQ